MSGVGDEQRPVGAVRGVVQPAVALHAAKVLEDGVPAPVGAVIVAAQDLVPVVIVGGAAADIDLRVHRRAAAEHIALRDVVRAAVEMRLRHGRVVLHVLAAVDHLEDAGRHVEQRMVVRMPRLEQQNAMVALGDQLRRGDTAGRPAADDDVVELLPSHSRNPP